MKAILLICVLYAHTYIATSKNFEFDSDIRDIIQRKCEINSGNTEANGNLKEGMDSLGGCLTAFIMGESLPDPLQQHDEFCRHLRESRIYECVSNFTEVLIPCLDETEAYFPDLMLTLLNTTYNEVCGVNGISNLEYLNKIFTSTNPEVNSCFETTSRLFRNDANFSNLTVYRNFKENSIINLNEKDICSDLKSLQKTLSLLMKQECNEDYSRFVDLYSQPFLEECNSIHN